MSYRVSNGAGTSFNTATNWDEGINTPSIHASTNITVSSGGVFSVAFTAPNLVNACTGVLVPVAAKGTAGNILATLQEYNGAAWVDTAATVTVAITSLVASTHTFFRFGTPYVFTTLTAGYYRIKLNTSGASGTTSIAADSGAANFAYIAYMNNNVVPGAGDDIHVVSPNQSTALTIALDSSPSIGSGGNTSVPTFRSWQNAIVLANLGQLAFATASSRTITCRGNIIIESGGWLQMGQTSAKIGAGLTAKISFDQNGVNVNYGLIKLNGGIVSMQSTALTYRKTTLSSGVGTAASPFVSSDSVDWAVGDELCFPPVSSSATNYDETETRFIITKNSATSYVLSATAGGGEVAFTYSHAAGYVFNLTRGCVIDTTNSTYAWYGDFQEVTTLSNTDVDGARFESFGSATASKTTIIFANISTEDSQVDDAVFYRSQGTGVTLQASAYTRTYTWLIFYDYNGVGNAGAFFCGARNKSFENCYCIDSQSAGFFPVGGSAMTFTDCISWACGRNSVTAYGGWFTQVFSLTQTRCESHANRTYGSYHSNTASGYSIDGFYGTKGSNGVCDVFSVSDAFVDITYENCEFGSTTLITNYLNLASGSSINFQNLNNVENTHRWYTLGGIGRSTGAGLTDTTTLKTGHLSARLDPEEAIIGQSFEFKILARVGEAVQCFGMIQKNAAMAADEVTVNLYLPGSTTPDDTYIMPTDSVANVFNVGVAYTGTVPLFARVVVTAKSVAVGAYVYIGNFYNGTDVLNAFDVWYLGKPTDTMVEQAGDSQAVWAVLTNTLTTAGTTGKKLVDDLETGQFLALK